MIPTINQFNKWTLNQQIKWILEETRYQVGEPALIIFPENNVAINYRLIGGEIVSAKAMTLNEGVNLFKKLIPQ